jgi:hypothetical protein
MSVSGEFSGERSGERIGPPAGRVAELLRGGLTQALQSYARQSPKHPEEAQCIPK